MLGPQVLPATGEPAEMPGLASMMMAYEARLIAETLRQEEAGITGRG